MEKSEYRIKLSPKQRRKQKWGVRIAWIKELSGGGIIRRSGPMRKGGTCECFGEVLIYDDVEGFVFIRNGEVLRAINKHEGFSYLCKISEVQAIWRLCNGEVDKLIFRQRQD